MGMIRDAIQLQGGWKKLRYPRHNGKHTAGIPFLPYGSAFLQHRSADISITAYLLLCRDSREGLPGEPLRVGGRWSP
ncbi:hypothetical protein V3C99_001459 [Haemonchus contortus]